MAYDFDLVRTLVERLSVRGVVTTTDTLEIELEPSMVLCFVNAKNDEESLLAFKDTPWHVHGDVGFADNYGNYLDLSYEDVILGLAAGSVLVCERWVDGCLQDRWLTHSEYADEFRFMQSGDEIRVKRLAVQPSA